MERHRRCLGRKAGAHLRNRPQALIRFDVDWLARVGFVRRVDIFESHLGCIIGHHRGARKGPCWSYVRVGTAANSTVAIVIAISCAIDYGYGTGSGSGFCFVFARAPPPRPPLSYGPYNFYNHDFGEYRLGDCFLWTHLPTNNWRDLVEETTSWWPDSLASRYLRTPHGPRDYDVLINVIRGYGSSTTPDDHTAAVHLRVGDVLEISRGSLGWMGDIAREVPENYDIPGFFNGHPGPIATWEAALQHYIMTKAFYLEHTHVYVLEE
mmetsp:Transcript_75749/g.227380  ORF Transcript_75749/g.227380 Transcript_75749/m.227380 type:complete len:266 (+) Transcript_75749:196-993(+)